MLQRYKRGTLREGTRRSTKLMSKLTRDYEIECNLCGGNHYPKSCYFKDGKCSACGKVGHRSRLCQAKKKGKQPQPVNEQKSGNS